MQKTVGFLDCVRKQSYLCIVKTRRIGISSLGIRLYGNVKKIVRNKDDDMP